MEGGRDAFMGLARPPPPSCSFLGSAATSSGGPQMLSFSSNGGAGLGLSSGASSMQGVLSRVRGPFTPTQWMELEHQALIYKYFVANAPVPSNLLLPIRRSLNPWSTFGSSSSGWAQLRPGTADAEPGRCRRTDGKKWRCSRDAVGDQRYCERHINRGRYRSRKHVEGQKATTTIAGPGMAVSAGVSSHSHTVAWQQQMEGSAANAANIFQSESTRELLDKQNMHDHLSVSSSTDFFDFSITHPSPNRDKVAFSAVEPQHGYDQTYNGHETCSSSEKSNESLESRLLVFRETIDDGPLGEVFKSKTCQPASVGILIEEQAANHKLHSPDGIPQMTSKFSPVSSIKTVPVENYTITDGYLTRRMVDYQRVPTLL